jgi:acetoin utilization deacetylase AcuC-like enzyme
MATGLVHDPRFLEHRTPPGHPERPERLESVLKHLERTGRMSRLVAIPAEPCAMEWIERVHPRAHVEELRRACASAGDAPLYLDPDTPVSAGSWQAALLACGGTLRACDSVLGGRVANAFVAARPPGHHAESSRAMGFCLLNQVAIAARYLQARHGIERVLIVDWDVHHGNGTQEIFYGDPSVLYFSTHEYPFYPGTGAREERGQGRGEGATLNVPMGAGAGDEEFLAAYRERLVPAARSFRPGFVLVSAGFDAHASDPLAGARLSTACYGELTRIVRSIADESCGGKLVSVLEGGYDLQALAESVAAHLDALA